MPLSKASGTALTVSKLPSFRQSGVEFAPGFGLLAAFLAPLFITTINVFKRGLVSFSAAFAYLAFITEERADNVHLRAVAGGRLPHLLGSLEAFAPPFEAALDGPREYPGQLGP
jgi:hypothetical protein